MVLERIRLHEEGSKIEFNEEAILKEYEEHEGNKSNLIIKVLSIFGGFLATLVFLVFLGIAGFYNSAGSLLIFGIGFVISALFLNKTFNKLITDTFSISLYIAGLILLAYGLSELGISINSVVLIISFLAFSSLIMTQNFILSFISILAISGGFLTLIVYNEAYSLIHFYIAFYTFILTYIFLYEAQIMTSHKKLSKLYNSMRIGLIFSLLFGLIAIGKRDLIPLSQNYIWVSSVFIIFAILYLVYTILKINDIEIQKNKVLIYLLSGLLLTPTLFSPAISGAILIILLSFLVNYKTGFALGIISIIYFISQYYYDLNFTLLTKSIILFISGLVFIAFYLFTLKNKNT